MKSMSDSCFLSAEHVEAVACKQAIQFAVDNNFWPVIIETDAQVVYLQLLNNSSVNLSILGRLFEDMGQLLQTHVSIKVKHIRRSANDVAHIMAANSKGLTSPVFYSSVPSFLQSALAAEIIQV
ncbi:hypothetical protein ACLB2K_071870 [Fragaria x ananassa]